MAQFFVNVRVGILQEDIHVHISEKALCLIVNHAEGDVKQADGKGDKEEKSNDRRKAGLFRPFRQFIANGPKGVKDINGENEWRN